MTAQLAGFSRMRTALRGRFITRTLLRAAIVIGALFLVLRFALEIWGARAGVATDDHLIGLDFALFWSTGVAVLRGEAALPFNIHANVALHKELFGAAAQVLGWHYPPFLLALVAPLGLLPYGWALGVWLSLTGALHVETLRRTLRNAPAPQWFLVLACLSFPGFYINAMSGQNGFLTSGLLGAALLCLRPKPILAGVFIGLLAYKPHFGLVIPFALIAGGHWRAFVSAGVTVSALVLATLLAFGTAPWLAFFANMDFTRTLLEEGLPGFHAMYSVFAAVRLQGGGIALAWAAQALVGTATLAAVVWLWRAGVDARLKAAGLVTAALLATPYGYDYDLVLLALPIALLAVHGLERSFGPWEHLVLTLAWIAPAAMRACALATGFPLGFVTLSTLFCVIISRARADAALAQRALHGTLAPSR